MTERLEGITVLLLPYELGAMHKLDIDDSSIIRMVAEWLDARPASLAMDLAGFMALRVRDLRAEAA